MLKEVINQKWKEAFKAKNVVVKSAYECLKAKIQVEEKSGRHTLPLSDDIIINIVNKEIKELKESQSFYKTEDPRYDEFTVKIEELSQYLPKQLSEEEVTEIIKNKAKIESNKGKLIGLVVKEVGNNFDKSKIAGLVSKILN